MTATALSYGGLAVTLAIIAVFTALWIRKGKDPKQLGPFAGGIALGALAVACTGGVFGWLGGAAGAAVNTAGTAATGAAATADGTVNGAATAGLTPGGAMVVVVAFAVGVFIAKVAAKAVTWQIIFGFLAGAAVALTAGGAGVLDGTLYAGANALGDAVLGAFNGDAS